VLEFPTIVVAAKGVEAILARWEVVERPKVEKAEIEEKDGGEGDKGIDVGMEEGGEGGIDSHEQIRDEAESEVEGNPPFNTTTPALDGNEAESQPPPKLPHSSAGERLQTESALLLNTNAPGNQAFRQPSPALPPPAASIDPSPSAIASGATNTEFLTSVQEVHP